MEKIINKISPWHIVQSIFLALIIEASIDAFVALDFEKNENTALMIFQISVFFVLVARFYWGAVRFNEEQDFLNNFRNQTIGQFFSFFATFLMLLMLIFLVTLLTLFLAFLKKLLKPSKSCASSTIMLCASIG